MCLFKDNLEAVPYRALWRGIRTSVENTVLMVYTRGSCVTVLIPAVAFSSLKDAFPVILGALQMFSWVSSGTRQACCEEFELSAIRTTRVDGGRQSVTEA